MWDLLTLRLRTKKSKIRLSLTKDLPSGVPINALQGWEKVPLHLKLPMLKAPMNQIIFSRNKIGKAILSTKQDYNPHCIVEKIEYNPLHDPHLKNFYSNHKILQRLLHNGEITPNNDVLCTLKEFNEYRELVHQSYLVLIRKEMQRLGEEQKDRLMLKHADYIHEKEEKQKQYHQDIPSNSQIFQTKIERDKKRQENFERKLAKSEQRIKDIKERLNSRKDLFAQRAILHNYQIRDHRNKGHDVQRKRLIALKKHLKTKETTLRGNLQRLEEDKNKRQLEMQDRSWQRRVYEKNIKEEKIEKLLNHTELVTKHRIEKHKQKYQNIWNGIQKKIENRAKTHQRRKKFGERRILKKLHKSMENRSIQSASDNPSRDKTCLKQMSKKDIRDALNTAIDMQEYIDRKIDFDQDDTIYKAARYIIEEILSKFEKDLSEDVAACNVVYGRIFRFFREAKEIVMQKAAHVITEYHRTNVNTTQPTEIVGDGKAHSKVVLNEGSQVLSRKGSMAKFVSFSTIPAIIGRSSYMIDHDVELKSSRLRPPTPTNSLTSVEGVIVHHPDEHWKTRLSLTHLSKEEQIFVEHFLVKFKRELLVGVGKRVFEAIECYKRNKIMHVRKELLDLDKNYLVGIMTRSIMSYAINSYNFQANLKLCVNALAGDIIWTLQKSFLKPARDPRFIQCPKSRCTCSMGQLTLFCG